MDTDNRNGKQTAMLTASGALLVMGMLALLLLYLNYPTGLVEQWAGKDRLPTQSATVAAMYRSALHGPQLTIPPALFRVLQAVILLIAFVGYGVGVIYSQVQSGPHARARVVTAVSIALSLLALVSPPLLSTDVFYYAATGELVASAAGNPYIATLDHFPEITISQFVYWTDFPTPYGPVWTDLSALLVWLSPDTPVAVSLAFKALAATSHLAAAGLIFVIVRRIYPDAAYAALVLYAWNPLVVLEAAGNGHNDAVTASLTLLAYWLLLEGLPYIGFIGALLSVGVKATTAPVAGLYALARARQSGGRRQALVLLATMVVTAVVLISALYSGYWQGPATLRGLGSQSGGVLRSPLISPFALIYHNVLPWSGMGGAALAVSWVATLALGAWALVQVVQLSPNRRPREVASEMHLVGVTLGIFPLVFSRSYPWYALVPLALLAASWPANKRSTLLLYLALSAWFYVDYVF